MSRKQVVLVNANFPAPPPLTYELLKGNVVSPRLFPLYIDGVLQVLNHGATFPFVDSVIVAFGFHQLTFNNITYELLPFDS